MGSDKVSDLPLDEVLKFDPAILPKLIPGQASLGYIYSNKNLENYWRTLMDTAISLEHSRDCYAERKAAAEGKHTSPFVGVDEIRAKDYANRFTGYEQKFAFVKEQLVALKSALSNLGFKSEAKPQDMWEPMQFLERIITSMDSADFSKFKPTKIAIVRL